METKKDNFYTVRGYRQRKAGAGHLTEATEDYLEMLCRCSRPGEAVRVLTLAKKLNVQPSSVSKMVGQMRTLGLVEAEPYGGVVVTENGRKQGEYLLHRHEVLLRFFHLLGVSDSLEEVELIEHCLSPGTVAKLQELMTALEDRGGGEPQT